MYAYISAIYHLADTTRLYDLALYDTTMVDLKVKKFTKRTSLHKRVCLLEVRKSIEYMIETLREQIGRLHALLNRLRPKNDDSTSDWDSDDSWDSDWDSE